MATYIALQDISVGQSYIQAGETFSDGAPDARIPVGWSPPACVTPITPDAIQNYWNAGVQLLGLVRQQWTNIGVPAASIYWVPVSPGSQTYILTGAGAALGPRDMCNNPFGAVRGARV